MNAEGWIGVDLDGTLAHYDGASWGPDTIGKPVPRMLERVKRWVRAGLDVRIFTARACHAECLPYIEAWCLEHVGVVLPITNVKDYRMIELWDDRAVAVEPNTGEAYRWTPRAKLPAKAHETTEGLT